MTLSLLYINSDTQFSNWHYRWGVTSTLKVTAKYVHLPRENGEQELVKSFLFFCLGFSSNITISFDDKVQTNIISFALYLHTCKKNAKYMKIVCFQILSFFSK